MERVETTMPPCMSLTWIFIFHTNNEVNSCDLTESNFGQPYPAPSTAGTVGIAVPEPDMFLKSCMGWGATIVGFRFSTHGDVYLGSEKAQQYSL